MRDITDLFQSDKARIKRLQNALLNNVCHRNISLEDLFTTFNELCKKTFPDLLIFFELKNKSSSNALYDDFQGIDLIKESGSIISSNLEQDKHNILMLFPKFSPAYFDNYKSLLSMPIRSFNTVLGLCFILSPQKDAFTSKKIILFEQFVEGIKKIVSRSYEFDNLRKRKDLFKVIIEQNTSLVSILDFEMNYMFANKKWCQHFQLPEDKIISESFLLTFPHHIPPHIKDGLERARHGNEERSDEDIIRYKDGTTDWIRWQIVPWYQSDNEIGGVIYTIDIITDKKRDKLEIEHLFEKTPDSFCILNEEGIFLQINPAFSQILGKSRENIIGTQWIQNIHPDDKEKVQHFFKKRELEKGINSNTLECRFICKNGFIKWLSWSFSELNDQGHIVGIAKDISPKKEMEQELFRLKLEAERANHSKTDLLIHITHELRTPLSSIIGLTELVKSNISDEGAIYYIDLIEKNGTHLLRTINDLLDLSKIDAGKLFIEQMPFDLKQELDLITQTITLKIDPKKVKFIFDWDQRMNQTIYLGDAFRIRQILLNILGNALKFTQEGHILFQTELSQNDGSQHIIKFSIKDTGIGIDKSKYDTIFSPFNQESTLIAQRYGGTGLGLSITKRLLTLMNGTISMISEKGKGSTFTITLPLPITKEEVYLQQLSTTSLPELSHNLLDDDKKSILVAEDDESGQILISAILKKLNYHFDIVSNGEEVISQLKEKKYNLILMDVQMPRLDGLETTRIIRQCGNDIPIVALTAHAMEEHKKMALAAGMNGHLTKPIDRSKLKKELDSYLNITQ